MLYPEINKLRDAAGCRYFLVSMASKRARDIIDGGFKLDERIKSNKPVSIAAEEIAEGLFTYKMIEDNEESNAMIDLEENQEETEVNEAADVLDEVETSKFVEEIADVLTGTEEIF